jgi:cytochrome c5
MRQSIVIICTSAILLSGIGLALAQRYHESPEAISKRIEAVGNVDVAGASTTTEQAADKPLTSEDIYNKYCVMCHAAGVAGAPVFRQQTFWRERLQKGFATVWKNSWEGINAMPARGGCMDCTKDDIRNVIIYMLPEALRKQMSAKTP